MAQREREYRWYRLGCERLGQPPLDEATFEAHWQEFEDYAERLKAAEAGKTAPDVDAAIRAGMQRRVQDDPFVRALLVGMAEENSAG